MLSLIFFSFSVTATSITLNNTCNLEHYSCKISAANIYLIVKLYMNSSSSQEEDRGVVTPPAYSVVSPK